MKSFASVPTSARSIAFRPRERRSIALLTTLGVAVCMAALTSSHVGAAPKKSLQIRSISDFPWTDAPIERQISLIPPDPIDPNQPIEPIALIEVSVDQEPEPSGKYLVDPAGNVPVLIAFQNHPVSVKDQTPAQAAVTLTRFLKKYLKHPSVRVTVIAAAR